MVGGSAASIVVMQADGSDARSVANLASWDAWTSDGSQILVAQGRITIGGTATGRSNLYLVSVDATDQPPYLLLDGAAIGSDPAW